MTRLQMSMALRSASETRPIHVTFLTSADGVKLPAYLREKYPEEMTVILQYEFRRLVVTDDGFEVGVWFKGRPAHLVVPYGAIKAFYDSGELKCG